jgi:hypothetical protein
MKTLKSVLISCTVLSVALFSAAGKDDEPPLPGSKISIEEAVRRCDVIAVAKLLELGDGLTRLPGYHVFHDANFEFKTILKGQAKGNATMAVYVGLEQHAPKGH